MSSSGSGIAKSAVLAQLDRILSSAVFRNSKRHSSLLRFLVEKTLEGEAAHIKERVLGVEVFGRPADYDNYSDPVVRISAGEIRKRIAQYYHELGHESEVRIELPLGSYVPEFLKPALPAEKPPAMAKPDLSPANPSTAAKPQVWLRPVLLASAFLFISILVAGLTWWRPWIRPTALDQFWQPYLTGAEPLTVCVGRVPSQGENSNIDDHRPAIAWTTVLAMAKMTGLVERKGRHCRIVRDDSLTYQELSSGPAIILRAFNNTWTLRLTENLRFSFKEDGGVGYIQDKNNMSSRAWSSQGLPMSRVKDYALISRLLASQIGQPVLIVAGVRGSGTEVAADFATSQSWIETMARKAPSGWGKKNVQIVLETQVINGNPGPPQIVAIHVW